MKIIYHCRSCNKLEEKDININDVIKQKTGTENMLSVLIGMLEKEHAAACKDPNIGIRSAKI